jgi:uncharacterized membrane protein HdeD (DUF308 family)
MPSIEDFTGPLFQGQREVFIPKEKITSLSPGWYSSKYNIPHKGSKGAWRFGRLHAHDLGDHWAVHLDRVDPQAHSMGHLIADAPLLLFIWSGFLAAMVMAKQELDSSLGVNVMDSVMERGRYWPRLIGGLILAFAGTIIILDPDLEILTFLLLIPVIIVTLGAMVIFNGLREKEEMGWKGPIGGALLVSFGTLGLLIEELILISLLLFLIFWTISSGVYSLVIGRDHPISRRDRAGLILTGALSLGLGLFLLFDIDDALDVLLRTVGVLVVFVGGMMILASLCIRMKNKRCVQ